MGSRWREQEKTPYLLHYAEGFLQVGHSTYHPTHETQAILWTTHSQTNSRNFECFPTSVSKAFLPGISCARRRLQAANIRANLFCSFSIVPEMMGTTSAGCVGWVVHLRKGLFYSFYPSQFNLILIDLTTILLKACFKKELILRSNK